MLAATDETISVTAFVDWKAQMHNTRSDGLQPPARATRTLERTARNIARVLTRKAPAARFTVAMRLYHGWHKGFEPTENLRAIMAAASQVELSTAANANVRFSPRIEYGHTLLSALRNRLHTRNSIHLPNTLRQQSRGEQPEEKMVDTALASDLLHWARNYAGEWALILAEDDDFIPPVFTAESWIKPHGGRVYLVRNRQSGPFLHLDGLLEGLNR